MICPNCSHPDDKVVDSRSAHDGRAIRRRRECLKCGVRFTTYETIEAPLQVIKRDGSREDFSKEKLLTGLRRACQKRPVSIGTLEDVVAAIQHQFEQLHLREVHSQEIGKMIMERLRAIDEVAYVRFASVYRQFKDVTDFLDEARRLRTPAPGESQAR
ncbi:transcriptional repressor NrdR [bacterium]|nr:transcriptional repressor NrdR [bacterium]